MHNICIFPLYILSSNYGKTITLSDSSNFISIFNLQLIAHANGNQVMLCFIVCLKSQEKLMADFMKLEYNSSTCYRQFFVIANGYHRFWIKQSLN